MSSRSLDYRVVEIETPSLISPMSKIPESLHLGRLYKLLNMRIMSAWAKLVSTIVLLDKFPEMPRVESKPWSV